MSRAKRHNQWKIQFYTTSTPSDLIKATTQYGQGDNSIRHIEIGLDDKLKKSYSRGIIIHDARSIIQDEL